MIIIAYIPALHRGYIDFFKKYEGGELYILGAPFIREFPRMDRDIRALEPGEIKIFLEPLGIFSKIEVLTEKNLGELKSSLAQIVMPDEDISRSFAEKHLPEKNAEFVSVFLRWDRQISTKELEVPPDRVISEGELDRELMAATQKEAEKSPDWWRQIGAALVKDKKVVLTAHQIPFPSEYSVNTFGDPRSNFDAGETNVGKLIHAEENVIAKAARKGIATDGASIYTTTFPCPMCAKTMIVAGIKKLYYRKGYSMLDAEDILRGNGVEIVLVK